MDNSLDRHSADRIELGRRPGPVASGRQTEGKPRHWKYMAAKKERRLLTQGKHLDQRDASRVLPASNNRGIVTGN